MQGGHIASQRDVVILNPHGNHRKTGVEVPDDIPQHNPGRNGKTGPEQGLFHILGKPIWPCGFGQFLGHLCKGKRQPLLLHPLPAQNRCQRDGANAEGGDKTQPPKCGPQPDRPGNRRIARQALVKPRQLLVGIFDHEIGLHQPENVFFPQVFRRRHVVHHRISRQHAAQQFVDGHARVPDRKNENQFPRLQRAPERTQHGIDDKNQHEKRHKNTHRNHAFDQ